jgi:hypothetical protein
VVIGLMFEVVFRYFPGEADEHLENVRIASLAVEILPGHLQMDQLSWLSLPAELLSAS